MCGSLSIAGLDYKELPDVYIIFISKFDIFCEKRTIYHIDRVIKETGTIVENGTHVIYVNIAVDDKSDIAELMQYFKKSVGQNPKFPKTCSRVDFFKKTKEGASIMCQVVEEYAAEKTKQTEIKWQQTFWKMVYLLTLLLNQHLRLRMILLQN